MKKRLFFLATVILIFSFISSACAAYTLPYKMLRQLEVGSGLKGSFVIHSNADAEKQPLIHALQNAEFEIRGIRSEDNYHYYIYQPGESEEKNNLSEFSILGSQYYFRSDLLDAAAYMIPNGDQFINAYFKTEENNPPILPDLIRIVAAGLKDGETPFSTAQLEKEIEIWISAFKSSNTIQSSENNTPRLTQEYRIPASTLFNAAANLVRTLTEDDAAMEYLRKTLTAEQIDTYLNPDLAYYYLDAMKNLSLEGDIVFAKTVSALGETIGSALTLPLDEAKTGFSSVTFESDETRKSFLLSGKKGVFYLNLPIGFDYKADAYDETIRLAYVNGNNPEGRNLALLIKASKTHDKYDDADETRNHEEDHYIIHVEKDTSGLPEIISGDLIPDMEPADAKIDLHYYSKLQLSSPTILEIGCEITQGEYNFSLAGKLKSASQWIFAPFDIAGAVDAIQYSREDFRKLKDQWIENADLKLERTPEEIGLAETSAADNPDEPANPDEIPEIAGTEDPEEPSGGDDTAEPIDSPVGDEPEESGGPSEGEGAA